MGKQSKTIRNKRKIKVENYENEYVNGKEIEKRVTKAFTREAQFTIVSIFFVTIVMISSAYAIFSSVQKQETYNTLTVGTLKIDFDANSTDMGNVINLNGAYPISDEEGQQTSPYKFKITNSGTLSAYYKVKIVDDTDMINEDGCQDNQLPKDKIKVSINGGEPFLLNTMEANSYIIDDGTLSAGSSKTYEIRIWLDETSGNEVLGKHYHGKIIVEGENTTTDTTNNTASVICKRATTLHTEECTQTDSTDYCSGAGYTESGSKGTTTITYGSTGTTGTLTSGDAFDCDVNGDGTYDEETERFYYVADMDEDTAVLIYYNNVSGGVSSNSTTYAYDSSNVNNNGPVTAMLQLPTTEQWKNVSLTNTSRAITNESGGTTTTAGDLPTAFSYEGYVARLLTAQEVNSACGITVGSNNTGELDSCNYLIENTKYSNESLESYGYWLETPHASLPTLVWCVNGYNRKMSKIKASYSFTYGVRPAIEILKSNISY